MEKKLTVVITTYNRKEELVRQLHSLELQGHFDKYEVVVSDNHSDYNVKEWLDDHLSSDFMKIVSIKVWEVNVGHELNATFSFLLPQTEWMWLLSDDDITEPNSLDIILSDIDNKNNQNVSWIKYSITGFKPNRECYLNNVTDIFNYYSNEKKYAGEWIFMSNNVYRLSCLKKYLSSVLIYSDNVQEPEVLALHSVKKDNTSVLFSSKSVTNYTKGNGSYNLIWAYSREGNLLFSGLDLNKSEIKAFKRMPFFSIRGLISSLFRVQNPSMRWEYFKRIFCTHYTIMSIKGLKLLSLYLIKSIGRPNC